jgi:hypothetical protein
MYADEDLSLPEIETLIYLGRTKTDDAAPIHLFQRAWSYHNEGDWDQMSQEQRAEYEEIPLVYFPVGSVEPICDGAELIERLTKWQSRKK